MGYKGWKSLTSEEINEGHLTEDELIKRVWYDEVFRKKVKNIISQLASHNHDAEEIYDESILSFVQRIRNGKRDFTDWKGYFLKICKHKAIDKLNKEKKHQHTYLSGYGWEGVAHNLEQTSDFELILSKENHLKSFWDRIKDITRKTDCIKIFELWYVESLSHKDIAQKLKINESSSRNKLNRCLDKLRAYFNNTEEGKQIFKILKKNYGS